MTIGSASDLPTKRKQHWRPFASFVIEYQMLLLDNQNRAYCTKVHHIEADTCAAWNGIEKEQLCQWISAQVDAADAEKRAHP